MLNYQVVVGVFVRRDGIIVGQISTQSVRNLTIVVGRLRRYTANLLYIEAGLGLVAGAAIRLNQAAFYTVAQICGRLCELRSTSHIDALNFQRPLSLCKPCNQRRQVHQ